MQKKKGTCYCRRGGRGGCRSEVTLAVRQLFSPARASLGGQKALVQMRTRRCKARCSGAWLTCDMTGRRQGLDNVVHGAIDLLNSDTKDTILLETSRSSQQVNLIHAWQRTTIFRHYGPNLAAESGLENDFARPSIALGCYLACCLSPVNFRSPKRSPIGASGVS